MSKISLIFALATVSVAQQRVPDFTGIPTCINFGGSLAIETKTRLVKMGVDAVHGFVDRNGDCRGVPGPHVRISVSQPQRRQASSESSSASGSTRGYSSSGSYSRSGEWIAVDATATLVTENGDYRRIGFFSEALQSGHASGSSSSAGNRFSTSGGFSRHVPADQTADTATRQALHHLLHSAKSWVPGANEMIAETFSFAAEQASQQPMKAQKPPEPSAAENIRAQIEAARAETAAVREKIRAGAILKKEQARAEKELAKAKKELAAAQNKATGKKQ